MQDFPGGRTASALNSKVSAPAGKEGVGLGLGGDEKKNDAITKPGDKSSIPGFSGTGVIAGKIK